MKKIFLFSVLFLFVLSLALPVLASEVYNFIFPYAPEDNLTELFVSECPTPGNYRYSLNLILGDGSEFPPVLFTGVCSVYSTLIEFDGEVGEGFYIPFSIKSGSVLLNFRCNWLILEPGLYFYYITNFNDDIIFTFNGSELLLEKISSPGFVDSVNLGLSSVFSWIHALSRSFFSGELSPLLAVFVLGICIAALFLGVRFIYKVCWGC